jgi:hypothetical protein
MSSKKKNIAQEPPAVYKKTVEVEMTSEKLHPVLVKLLEISKKNHEDGKVFSHDEVRQKVKERFPFLK